ncbi:hypothetical protein FRC11_010340, partial [Ceratobasidium sp. 423]
MARVHPVWGRPFEQYINLFTIEATKKRIRWRHDFELDEARSEAAEVTKKIYKIAGEWKDIDSRNLEGYITLPMLKSIEKLSRSPITLVDFSHTALISGCVKLMHAASKALRQSERSSSLLSYEYGYLCLRIITITVGVCLLQRTDRFSKFLNEMLSDSETDIVLILSRHVSMLIQDELHVSKRERDFDWILGWAKSDHHPLQEPFAARSDMWMLLNLLYDDRKRFLSIFTSTYSLGLSGLMFLLWRYHRFDRSEDFIPLFGDILLRYFLVAPTNQLLPLTSVFSQTKDIARLKSPKFVDLEDSKAIISACARCLAPTDTDLYEPLPVSAFSVHLFCIMPFLRPGCEHLIPALFRAAIQRFWKALVDNEAEGPVLVDVMRDVFEFFRQFLEFLRPKSTSNQAAVTQIVEELAENEFVGLTLRVMLMLNMEVAETSAEFGMNGQYIAFSANFFQTLGQVAPRELLQAEFADIAPGLARYALFLRWRRTLKGLTEGEMALVMGASASFGRILSGLQQGNNIKEFEQPPGTCSYSRCPYPGGARCQAADWRRKDSQNSHKELCPGDLNDMGPLQLLETLRDHNHLMAMDEN